MLSTFDGLQRSVGVGSRSRVVRVLRYCNVWYSFSIPFMRCTVCENCTRIVRRFVCPSPAHSSVCVHTCRWCTRFGHSTGPTSSSIIPPRTARFTYEAEYERCGDTGGKLNVYVHVYTYCCNVFAILFFSIGNYA